MDKTSFVFFADWFDAIKDLDDDDRLMAYDAIMRYAFLGERPTDRYIGALTFLMFKGIDRNNDKFEDVKKKRSDAGKKGNLKRWGDKSQKVAKIANATDAKNATSQNIAKIAYNENENENENKDSLSPIVNNESEKENKKNLSILKNKEENGDESEPSGEPPAEPPKPKTTRFIKPTIEQVAEYIQEKGYEFTADAFYDFYESKGWMIGKNHMKDWKAACRTWNRTRKETQIVTINPNNQHGQIITDGDKRRIDKARRDAEFDELMYELAVTNRPASEDERVKQISTR